MAPQDLHARLDAYWDAVQALGPSSTDDDFNKVTAFIAPQAALYLNGMGAPPARGPAEAVATYRGLVQFWAVAERRVLSRAITSSPDSRTAVCEMDNRLVIMGEAIEHFPEMEVVEFDDEGLIASYRLYCDPKVIVDIVTAKTAAAAAA